MLELHPYASGLLGGIMIGSAAAMLWITLGKTAGISGILGGLIGRAPGWDWRLPFLIGLVTAGIASRLAGITIFEPLPRSPAALIAAGLLVGFGTRLGNGCTSGHGVCGVARLSHRSLLATATFMASGALTVFLVNRLLGGRL
jgi:uncharacterized protein